LTEFLLGCAWQRCTVHFLRDCLGHARKDQHGLLGALIRPIFNCDSLAQARDRLSEAVAHLDGRLGKVATMLKDAEPEILAFYVFPAGHWRKLRSTNPLERFNKEIGRRTDVVGIFPNDQSLVRLAGMLCIEQSDEWLVGRGYLSAESISLVLAGPDDHLHRRTQRAPLHHVPELDCRRAGSPIPGHQSDAVAAAVSSCSCRSRDAPRRAFQAEERACGFAGRHVDARRRTRGITARA
jgi:hypothetical protein